MLGFFDSYDAYNDDNVAKYCPHYYYCEQADKTIRNCMRCPSFKECDSCESKVLTTDSHTFKIVETLPQGYVIWNIGRRNFPFECYIPLCRQDKDYNIDPETLKAYKVKSEEYALWLMSEGRSLNCKELKNLL